VLLVTLICWSSRGLQEQHALKKRPQIGCRRGENVRPFFFSLCLLFLWAGFSVCRCRAVRAWCYQGLNLCMEQMHFNRSVRGQMFESLVLLLICYSFSTIPSDSSGCFSSPARRHTGLIFAESSSLSAVCLTVLNSRIASVNRAAPCNDPDIFKHSREFGHAVSQRLAL